MRSWEYDRFNLGDFLIGKSFVDIAPAWQHGKGRHVGLFLRSSCCIGTNDLNHQLLIDAQRMPNDAFQRVAILIADVLNMAYNTFHTNYSTLR